MPPINPFKSIISALRKFSNKNNKNNSSEEEEEEYIEEEENIKEEEILLPNNSNFLFLGTLESGKSTLFKQLKHISNKKSYSQMHYSLKNYILEEIIETMCLFGYEKKEEIEKYVGKEIIIMKDFYEHLLIFSEEKDLDKNDIWDKEFALQLKEFYFTNLNILQYFLCDINNKFCYNIDYYMNDFDRIMKESYTPNFKDYLTCRIKTAGIIDEPILYFNKTFTILDVSGARSERQKWKNIIIKPNYLIYTVSLMDYFRNCWENDFTNRLKDSLDLFENLLKNNYLQFNLLLPEINFILMFTHIDKFVKYLEINTNLPITVQRKEHSYLSNVFNEFKGNEFSLTDIFNFILQKYKDIYFKYRKEEIEYHVVNLLNENEVKTCWHYILTKKGKFISQLLNTHIKQPFNLQTKLFKSLQYNQFIDLYFK
ncbi:hypothetical protein ABK040_011210 [Willaertia magna]